MKFLVSKHPSLNDALVVRSSSENNHLEIYNKEIIVDICCGSAVLRGAHVFAPGVMAASAGQLIVNVKNVMKNYDKR